MPLECCSSHAVGDNCAVHRDAPRAACLARHLEAGSRGAIAWPGMCSTVSQELRHLLPNCQAQIRWLAPVERQRIGAPSQGRAPVSNTRTANCLFFFFGLDQHLEAPVLLLKNSHATHQPHAPPRPKHAAPEPLYRAPTIRLYEDIGTHAANQRSGISSSSAIQSQSKGFLLPIRSTTRIPTIRDLSSTPRCPNPVSHPAHQSTTHATMASIVRPSLLRQSALAARPAFSARSAIAMRAAAFHSSSKKSAILPPGPRT
jgi:hypothetical protein